MPLTIPLPIKPYNRQLSIVPSLTYAMPAEGRMVVPLEIDWDGAGTTFEVNVAGRSNQPFSQIVMLDVDNSASGADVQFIFPDTQDTLTVPAYSAGTFPVFTGGRLFYASAPAALATDITRVRVLNYRQEPIANPAPQFHSANSSGAVAMANATQALLAPNVSGTLIGYSLYLAGAGGAAGGGGSVTLKDHATGNAIDTSLTTLPPNGTFNGLVANVSGMAFRFAGGLDLTMAINGNFSGSICANLKYRTP